MIHIGLIGVTGFGNAHFNALRRLEEEGRVKIAAATIINREEAANNLAALEASGCRIYGDYQDMLDGERGKCDLISIPTGIAWHCPMTVNALRAGFHVLVEKPAAGTVAEVDEMIAARDAAGRRVFVGFHDLYLDPIIDMKKRILDGQIGDLQSVSVKASWPRPKSYYDRNNWAGRVKVANAYIYDSPANNALAHFLMGALYFSAGELNTVSPAVTGQGELYRAKPIESFDTMSIRLQTESGVDVMFTVTHSGASNRTPTVLAQGSNGSVRWIFGETITLEPAGISALVPAGPPNTYSMFSAIVEAMESGAEVGCTLEMAREHTRVINALHALCPIEPVPERFLRRLNDRDDELIVIDGIEEAMDQAFAEGKLFSEMVLPWSQPATNFILEAVSSVE